MRDGRLVVLWPRAVHAGGGRVVFDADASGLRAGDRVVTSQIAHPRDGMALAEPAATPATRSAATADGKDAT